MVTVINHDDDVGADAAVADDERSEVRRRVREGWNA